MDMSLQGAKVVIADGDRTVLELLQIRLDIAGFHTCVARNGDAVFETLKLVRPVAMIIDLALPGMDGFEVMSKLTVRGAKLPCPTIVMGRKLGPDDIRRAIALGARDCLIKPFSGADALERVSRLLRPPKPAPARPPVASAAYI